MFVQTPESPARCPHDQDLSATSADPLASPEWFGSLAAAAGRFGGCWVGFAWTAGGTCCFPKRFDLVLDYV